MACDLRTTLKETTLIYKRLSDLNPIDVSPLKYWEVFRMFHNLNTLNTCKTAPFLSSSTLSEIMHIVSIIQNPLGFNYLRIFNLFSGAAQFKSMKQFKPHRFNFKLFSVDKVEEEGEGLI